MTSYTTHEPVNGEWSMCKERRCRFLKTLGSITINARAIFDDEGDPPVVHLVTEDSRAFRVIDTTPKVYIPSSRKPYCSGNRDKCNEIASVVKERVPGSEIGLGAERLCPSRNLNSSN